MKELKIKSLTFIFGKGITRGKILAAMLFGMFMVILKPNSIKCGIAK